MDMKEKLVANAVANLNRAGVKFTIFEGGNDSDKVSAAVEILKSVGCQYFVLTRDGDVYEDTPSGPTLSMEKAKEAPVIVAETQVPPPMEQRVIQRRDKYASIRFEIEDIVDNMGPGDTYRFDLEKFPFESVSMLQSCVCSKGFQRQIPLRTTAGVSSVTAVVGKRPSDEEILAHRTKNQRLLAEMIKLKPHSTIKLPVELFDTKPGTELKVLQSRVSEIVKRAFDSTLKTKIVEGELFLTRMRY